MTHTIETLEQISSARFTLCLTRDGKIRTRPRGEVLGTIEHEDGTWYAYSLEGHMAQDGSKKTAAQLVLTKLLSTMATDYLTACIRAGATQAQLEAAIATAPHAGGIKGLATEQDLRAATREAARTER
jgi:hypothetical protein